MTHGPEHHVEHAEHASHAAHNPFDRQVTMTIAIVAALLACATMLSHRSHTQTLQLQILANDAATKTFNEWNQYQAKRNRQDLHSTKLSLVKVLGTPKDLSTDAQKERQSWASEIERYKEETRTLAEQAKKYQQEAEDYKKQSAHMHHLSDQYDMSELGIEVALVLCSLAVLTKRRSFWLGGLIVGLAGLAVLLVGVYHQYFAHH